MKLRPPLVVIFGLVAAIATAQPVTSAGSAPQLERLAVPVSSSQLTVWSRRPAHPRGVVVLVHGRTWSARPAFDLEARSGSRSLLKAFAVCPSWCGVAACCFADWRGLRCCWLGGGAAGAGGRPAGRPARGWFDE